MQPHRLWTQSNLSTPIIRVFDVDEQKKRFFFPAKSVSQVLKRAGTASPPVALHHQCGWGSPQTLVQKLAAEQQRSCNMSEAYSHPGEGEMLITAWADSM